MSVKIGINGFGRMGRLALRTVIEHDDICVTCINDPAGNAESFAHLVNHDSVHGTWHYEAVVNDTGMQIGAAHIAVSHNSELAATDWSACDLVIEASGKFLTASKLQPYLDQGVARVVVTAPVKAQDVPDIVMGVNDAIYCAEQHRIVTAASCTTNCLAPVIKVVHERLGIERGAITTIHDITNTQSILDTHHKDLRRARASSLNLIPTTTGSAVAITRIFPELAGRLHGHAVRVPLANASLTDCVFELSRPTTAEEVNTMFSTAAQGELSGILGYEERPLVSADFRGDARSCIIDAPSTLVIDSTLLKVYAWYDNEWGYVQRVIDLLRMVAGLAPR